MAEADEKADGCVVADANQGQSTVMTAALINPRLRWLQGKGVISSGGIRADAADTEWDSVYMTEKNIRRGPCYT